MDREQATALVGVGQVCEVGCTKKKNKKRENSWIWTTVVTAGESVGGGRRGDKGGK